MEIVSFFNYKRKPHVSQAKAGDTEAFLALINENKINIYRIARGILKCEEDIKDAMQNSVIKAFENITTLKQDKYFKTWLTRIVINECTNILNKNSKNISLDDDKLSLYDKHYDNYENFDLIKSINSLNEELRITITLFYFDDMCVKEIADLLEISEGTVKSRLNRARIKIKEFLNEVD